VAPGTGWSNMRDAIRRATGSVRLRVTLAATLLVGVVLIVAAALLTWTVERKLVDDKQADADMVVRTVAADFEAGEPFTLPLAAGGSQTAVGVYTSGGDIVSGVGAPALEMIVPAPTAGGGVQFRGAVGYDATVAMRAARLGDSTFYVVGVSPLDDVRESVRALGQNLRLGIPLVTALFAVVAWYLTGRALRPVETIRTQVESISATTLDRRVPVPAAHDEVSRLARTMNAMLDRLHHARDRERQFIADASHELRSPLASLRAQLETDPQYAPSEGTRADLERLQHVIDDLVDLARASDAPLPDDEIDLDEVVLAEIGAVHARAIHVDASGVTPVKVSGSAAALGRLTRNLLDNAVRHADGRVSVALTNGGDHVRLVVDDDGEGVAPADRQRVFDRFARLDDGRARSDGGVGLGLAVVKATAERHGGKVVCDEAPLGGARFEVTLPARVSV
jgi:signal transduction histidine kinase